MSLAKARRLVPGIAITDTICSNKRCGKRIPQGTYVPSRVLFDEGKQVTTYFCDNACLDETDLKKILPRMAPRT